MKNGGVWKGIYSKNLQKVYGEASTIKTLSGGKGESMLYLKEIGDSQPVLNFMIIEYKIPDHEIYKDEREVLFGWGHHKYDEQGHVFSSRNKELVDTFDRLFQAYSEVATEPKQDEGKKEEPKDTVPFRREAAAE